MMEVVAADDTKTVSNVYINNFLKPVNPAPKVKKKKVLDEETYVKRIEEIIERDFFPLPAAVNERTDDNASADQVANSRRADYSPATFETPEHSEQNSKSPSENTTDSQVNKTTGKRECDRLPNLDTFLNCHTSEDNDSFEDLMIDANERMREKYPWLFKEEQLALEYSSEKLRVPSLEDQANPVQRPINVDTWAYKNKNYIMYTPDSPILSEKQLKDLIKTKNCVVYENTRFQQNPFDERRNQELIQQMAQTQAQQSLDGKIGIDGKELISDMSGSDKYSFVRTPSPMPGVQDSPFMTWGDIEGNASLPSTPLIAASSPSFRIVGPSEREKLANTLTNEIRDKHKLKMQASIESRRRLVQSSPLLRSHSSLTKMSMLSPAARHLATAQLKHMRTDSALRASYSPKTPGSVRTPHTTLVGNRERTPSGISNISTALSNHITDNLLNLPKRPR